MICTEKRGILFTKERDTMLLAIDIGNTNISVGLFGEDRELKFLSSIDTDSGKTADQIKATWAADVEKFKAQRKPYLIYKD